MGTYNDMLYNDWGSNGYDVWYGGALAGCTNEYFPYQIRRNTIPCTLVGSDIVSTFSGSNHINLHI